jgi:hypothetical protein
MRFKDFGVERECSISKAILIPFRKKLKSKFEGKGRHSFSI